MGPIEAAWIRSDGARRHARGLTEGPRAAGPSILEGTPSRARARRDDDGFRLRADLLRQHAAEVVRLHGSWRRFGMDHPEKPPGVRLGRYRCARRREPGGGRYDDLDSRSRDGLSVDDCAEHAAPPSSSRCRGGNLSRRDSRPRAHDRRERSEHASRGNRLCRRRRALDPVLSDPRIWCCPGGGSSNFKRRGRRRSLLPSISRRRGSSAISTTAILVETRRAKGSRTMKRTKRPRRAAPSFTGCPCPDGFGTTGNISTRSGLSSTSPCSSRAS